MGEAGFTGTRQGMTWNQRAMVTGLLYLKDVGIIHHGGCIGADIDLDQICWDHIHLRTITVIHPSNLKDQQGKWYYSLYVRGEKPPLERNKDIVDESEFLIATPKEYDEVIRSGTWATIRYAKKVGKPVYIIYPNGRTDRHD